MTTCSINNNDIKKLTIKISSIVVFNDLQVYINILKVLLVILIKRWNRKAFYYEL